jgi:hypothetical protein
MTVLSDGTVVCASIDAGKLVPLGNVNRSTVSEIWNGPAYESLRRDLVEDFTRRSLCTMCSNRFAAAPREPGKFTGIPLPRFLYIESVAACNLACPGCDREAIEGTRERAGLVMPLETCKKLVDELSPHLELFEYHVGGENWAHKDSAKMIRYAKAQNPHCFAMTSTNGHYFHTPKQREDALFSGIDAIIFSVDGATQKSYEQYRVHGNFQRVYDDMKALVAERDRLHVSWPKIVWRYILFPWNDSDAEMDLARRMAKDAGVDYFAWQLNIWQAPHSISARYFHGSPHLDGIRHEMWEALQAMIPVNPRWEIY